MKSLEPHLNNLDKLIVRTSLLCAKLQHDDYSNCKDIFSPIEVLLEASIIKSQSLSHIISNDVPTRFKRSLEFGGEILKFFFGTLDADDARKYDAAINAYQKNEHELYNLMKDNIHIVKSSISSFNSTIAKLNQNEIKINSQINKLNDILSEVTKDNDRLVYSTKLNNLINIIEGSLLTLSNFLDSIINSILFSKVNVLHPSVLSPTKLYNELNKRSSSISNKLDFPVSLTLDNIHTLIDVSKLIAYYYNDKIIFVIQIPLIFPIKYVIHKIIPLPTPHDKSASSTFALITPIKPYIALTDDRLHYTMLDSMQQCYKLSSDRSICPYKSVFSSITNPSCETKLLTEVVLSLPKQCNSKLLYGLIDIWHKLENNRWIYVQSNMNKLSIKCNDNIKDYSIQGTGILSLSENCIAFSKTIRLEPSSSSSFVISSNLNIDFDITNDDCCKKENFNKSIPRLSPLTLSNIDLDSLKHSYRQLSDLEDEINKIQEESHFVKYASYYSSLTIISLILIFLFLAYKLYQCYRKHNINTNPCCIQIFNQCNTKRQYRHESKIHNSIEMSDISEEDRQSTKSLPDLSYYKRNIANN